MKNFVTIVTFSFNPEMITINNPPQNKNSKLSKNKPKTTTPKPINTAHTKVCYLSIYGGYVVTVTRCFIPRLVGKTVSVERVCL